MKNQNENLYVLVSSEKLDKILESIEYIKQKVTKDNIKNNSLGDYISEKEAKSLLSKGTTWFWNKRKTGDLRGRKAGNKWYYKKQEIIKFIDKGKTC